MNRKLLASAICASLLVAGAAYAQDNPAPAQSQDQSTTTQANPAGQQKKKEKEETKTLKTIQVTGSLIPQSQIETASPVITITAQDLQKEGFKNVYDALRSLPTANGAVLDNQNNNTSAPGTNTVSLLGLPPGFTLILIDGRPLADYPLAFNFSGNFVDLGTIPSSLVDRIEIVPGNQSAIYGSSAIAGVINIILKQHMQGVDLDYRAGGYTDGGGQQQRLQISGGRTFGKLDLMGAVELNKQNSVFWGQRDYTDSNLDSPSATAHVPGFSRIALLPTIKSGGKPITIGGVTYGGGFADPPDGEATCDAISNLFHGTMQYGYSPRYTNTDRFGNVSGGHYCGTMSPNSTATMLNGYSSINFYGKANYDLNNNTKVYADFLFNATKQKYQIAGAGSFWGTAGGNLPNYIWDLDTDTLERLQHVLAPEETGDLVDPVINTHSWVLNLGIKGNIGNSDWNYDAYYHRSQYVAQSRNLHPLSDKVDAFFLGPQDGVDPLFGRYPAFHVEQNGKMWGAITPAEYASYSDWLRNRSETYTQQGTVTITNTDLFNMPAGAVGFAGQLTIGDQYLDNPIDPRVKSGDFWGIGGTTAGGTRDFQAAAFELNVPVFKMLTADLSARYDRYAPNGGMSDSKWTYKAGLEFRPIDTLLFRANYATAFRAPDLAYVFSNGSKAYDSSADYYNCRVLYGDDLSKCKSPYTNVQYNANILGNKDLQYITAKSWGYGVVWSPTKNLTLKSDYYHVKIANEIGSYSDAQVLQHEADCRIGHTIQGTPVDINSAACQQWLSLVQRTPMDAPVDPGSIDTVTTFPMNVAKESVSGIQASGQYRWSWGRYGDFSLDAAYSVQTSHLQTLLPGDDPDDLLRTNSYGNQFKNIANASLSWDIGNWSTTLTTIRTGKTFSYNGKFTVGPWIRYNATVQYHVTPDITATLIGNNILNARPPLDKSFTAFPYFDIYSYNALGRMMMLELDVKFH